MALKQYARIVEDLERAAKPYRGEFPSYDRLPPTGIGREQILREMQSLHSAEAGRWKEGYASGAVYHGDEGHIDFLNRVYGLHSQSNPLHSDLWPSTTKFEAEIVAMTANMLGADNLASPDGSKEGICGTVSSGGTESILLAMKTYRDWGREKQRVKQAEIIAPLTAHAAFDKAAQYFNMKLVRVPVDDQFMADVRAVRKALSKNTVVIVGSAPAFPHGMVDPIAELSELARERGIGFHTDACLGGFLLPWAEKLGYRVPAFDFRLPGVTSISADTHKFGYAAKGTSVILYRGLELRHYQYYIATDWPGGLYLSPTLAGSRPGGLSAAAWAAMVSMGEQGYLEAARRILETADKLKEGIRKIDDLILLGDSLFVVALGAKKLDIYKIMDFMGKRHWNLNGLQKPASVHLCVTLRHTQAGVPERFLADLGEAVEYVKIHPEAPGTLGPVYGLASSLPFRGLVRNFLRKYLDMLYKV
ncbi:MAG TPA: aminotransferase class V-fold PLP-dependent enzyme [Anaerolineales bacterium]|nr:aminotransferase class V-fold PLP-dependent enzyme [Anaerolineales bacterium]